LRSWPMKKAIDNLCLEKLKEKVEGGVGPYHPQFANARGYWVEHETHAKGTHGCQISQPLIN